VAAFILEMEQKEANLKQKAIILKELTQTHMPFWPINNPDSFDFGQFQLKNWSAIAIVYYVLCLNPSLPPLKEQTSLSTENKYEILLSITS